ncbi:MAG: DUF4260 domain-containing protein [Candidatus Roizmanbacteria bacterium]|nr:DUF4260 domain-containing protein [Candidatus Roizmanbacteria bacterium]
MNMNFQDNIVRILRSESLMFFVATVWAYYLIGASWWMFVVLILAPDIFMVGYLKNLKLGAMVYNIGHTYTIPFVLFGLYMLVYTPILLPVSIIWIAHISMDRMLGFGLKLDSGFKHTHLGEIGKKQ